MYPQHSVLYTATTHAQPLSHNQSIPYGCHVTPPPPPKPVIIQVNHHKTGVKTFCPTCGKETANESRKIVGCVAWAWCCILLVLSFGLACCYAVCKDDCKDTQLLCKSCHSVKANIPANCC